MLRRDKLRLLTLPRRHSAVRLSRAPYNEPAHGASGTRNVAATKTRDFTGRYAPNKGANRAFKPGSCSRSSFALERAASAPRADCWRSQMCDEPITADKIEYEVADPRNGTG